MELVFRVKQNKVSYLRLGWLCFPAEGGEKKTYISALLPSWEWCIAERGRDTVPLLRIIFCFLHPLSTQNTHAEAGNSRDKFVSSFVVRRFYSTRQVFLP